MVFSFFVKAMDSMVTMLTKINYDLLIANDVIIPVYNHLQDQTIINHHHHKSHKNKQYDN